MEADLSLYHGLDYRDRWAFDANGRRKLTLRMIAVRLRHLPPDASVVRVTMPEVHDWGRSELLLAQVWQQLAQKPHPWLEAIRKGRHRNVSPERLRQLELGRRRAAERERLIELGEIT